MIGFLLYGKAAGVALMLTTIACLAGGALFMAKTAGHEARAEQVVQAAIHSP